MASYGLKDFIKALQELDIKNADALTNIQRVRALLLPLLKQTTWLEDKYYQVDADSGFKSWLLHEEADHTLAVNLVAWQPAKEITPHDHKTWGLVGCVVGIEKNYFWQRLDDGSIPGHAKIIRKTPATVCQTGDIISFMPNDIHSVINESDQVAISLHVYGKNLNYTGRFQYDPIKETMQPFIVNFN